MADYHAGSASVTIRPDLSKFAQTLRRELQRVKADEKVSVSPDMDSFAAQLKTGLAARDEDVTVDVKADTAKAAADIADLSDVDNVTVKVDADTIQAAAKIEALADSETVTLNVDADTLAAAAKIDETARDRDLELDVDADTTNAEAHIRAAAGRIRAALSDAFKFEGADKRIGAVTGALGGLVTMGARVGGMVVMFGALGTAVAGVAGPLAGMVAALTAASGVLLALPAAMAGAGIAAGVLAIGLKGITDESADLADSARETVSVVKSFNDEWGDLRKSVQGALFEGVAASVQRLGGLLPLVRDGFTGIAGAINGGARDAVSALTTEGAKLDLRATLDNTTRGFQNMAGAAAPLAQVWRDLHTVSSEFFPAIGSSIANASNSFADFIRNARETGELKAWIQGGIDVTRSLGGAFVDTGVIIANVFRAATNSGAPFLGFMGEALNRLRAWTSSLEGMATMERFFTSTTNALTALLPAVGELAGAIANGLVPWAERLLVAFGPGLASGVAALGSAFEALIPSAEPLGELLGLAVDGLGRIIAAAAPVVDVMVGRLAPALGSVIDPLVRIVEVASGASFSTFSVAVTVAAGALEALAVPLKVVADLMEAHPGIVSAAIGAWAAWKGVPMLMSRVGSSLEPVTKRFSGLTTGLKEARGSLRDYVALNPEVSRMGAAWKTLETTVPTVGRLSQAYRDGASKLAPFVSRHNEAAIAARNLGTTATTTGAYVGAAMQRMGHTTAASMGSFAGAMRGVGTGALAGFKGAIGGVSKAMGGLMGALGGPWGIALMVGATAIQGITDGTRRWNEYQAASRDLAQTSTRAYHSMFDAIASGSSQIDAMSSQIEGLESNLTRLAGNAPTFWQKVSGQTEAGAEINAQIAEKAKAGIDELGMSHEQLAQKITGSEASWQAFSQQLLSAGGNQTAAAMKLQDLRDAHVQAQDAVRQLGPAAAHAADTIRDIANSSDDAATKTEKLRQAFNELRGVNVSADEAAANLTKTLDSVSSSMDQVAGATLKANGTINTTTTAGAALYDALDQIGAGMQKSVSAGNNANQVFGQSAGKLEALRQAAGLGKAEWDQLLQKMGMTPKQLETTAKVNAEPAKAEVAQLQAALSDWDGKPTTKTLTIRDEEAKQRIESMGFRISEYDKKTGLAKIAINDQASVDKLNWWVTNGFPQIDMANPTAKVNLDASGLFFTAEYAKFQLSRLDKSRPNPLLNMDISRFNGKQIKALQDVGLLDGQRPNPKAGMTIRDLTREQQVALAKVLDLGSKKPKPVASLNNSPLVSGVDASKNKMGELRDKNVTVHFQAVYSGFKDSISGASRFIGLGNYAGGAWTGERALPGFAHGGYKLPTFGPGTDRRDGFLAFDSMGVPSAMLDAGEWIINRRSSEKYNKELAQINAGTFPKLPGYAEGGRHGVKHADEIDKFARGLQGKPYVFGGIHWGDCSGAMSAIARFAVGLAPFAARFTTASERGALAALGFKTGRGGPGDLRMGWKNGGPGGGHTAGTLPNGVNVEMGGANPSMGKYGGRAAGANDPSFNEHAYLPVPTAYKVTRIDGWNPGSFQDGLDAALSKNGSQLKAGDTTITQTSGPSSTGEQLPTTISGWAAKLAAPFIQGQVADVLKVLGVSDNPPILQAYQQYMQSQKQNVDGSRTITHVDKAKVAKLEKQIREAKEDLRLKEARQKEKRAKVGVNKKGKRVGPSETTLAAGELDIRRKKERIRELEKQLAEEKRGYVYNVQKDGTLGGKVKEKVLPAVGAGQTGAGKRPGVLDWPTANGAVDVKYNPKLGAEQWRPVVRVALKRHGLPVSANEDRTIQQIRIESNGNPRAVNKWDSNAKKGTPSGGLLQVIKPTFDAMRKKYATAFRGVSGDQFTPLPNLLAGIGWARYKYGGPSKIWPTRAGYRDGGLVRGPGGKRDDLVPAWLSDMEFVVNAAATAKNRGLLEAVNAGVPVSDMVGAALGAARGVLEGAGATDSFVSSMSQVPAAVAAPVPSNGEVHNHFMAASPEEMYRMYRREASRTSHGVMGAR